MNSARIRPNPIPAGGDAAQPVKEHKFRDMSTLDPRYLQHLAAQAQAKFPDKIAAIGKKYGAYEYIVSEDQLVSAVFPFAFLCPTNGVHLSRKC